MIVAEGCQLQMSSDRTGDDVADIIIIHLNVYKALKHQTTHFMAKCNRDIITGDLNVELKSITMENLLHTILILAKCSNAASAD